MSPFLRLIRGGAGGVLVLGIYIQIPCDSMSSFSDGALRRIFPPLRPKFLHSTGDEMGGDTGGQDRPDALPSPAQIPGPLDSFPPAPASFIDI